MLSKAKPSSFIRFMSEARKSVERNAQIVKDAKLVIVCYMHYNVTGSFQFAGALLGRSWLWPSHLNFISAYQLVFKGA